MRRRLSDRSSSRGGAVVRGWIAAGSEASADLPIDSSFGGSADGGDVVSSFMRCLPKFHVASYQPSRVTIIDSSIFHF